jgi:hypothetical protein
MISSDIILIDRPLHQPHAKRTSIEAIVLPDIARDRREMVNAGKLHALIETIVADQ